MPISLCGGSKTVQRKLVLLYVTIAVFDLWQVPTDRNNAVVMALAERHLY